MLVLYPCICKPMSLVLSDPPQRQLSAVAKTATSSASAGALLDMGSIIIFRFCVAQNFWRSSQGDHYAIAPRTVFLFFSWMIQSETICAINEFIGVWFFPLNSAPLPASSKSQSKAASTTQRSHLRPRVVHLKSRLLIRHQRLTTLDGRWCLITRLVQ